LHPGREKFATTTTQNVARRARAGQGVEGAVSTTAAVDRTLELLRAASLPYKWDEASAGKSATVNVIDETLAGVQTVAMTCTVSAGAKTCSNTGTGTIAAGHYLMVRIDTTASGTTWRVSFRY
jgi:hypothetical protein